MNWYFTYFKHRLKEYFNCKRNDSLSQVFYVKIYICYFMFDYSNIFTSIWFYGFHDISCDVVPSTNYTYIEFVSSCLPFPENNQVHNSTQLQQYHTETELQAHYYISLFYRRRVVKPPTMSLFWQFRYYSGTMPCFDWNTKDGDM